MAWRTLRLFSRRALAGQQLVRQASRSTQSAAATARFRRLCRRAAGQRSHILLRFLRRRTGARAESVDQSRALVESQAECRASNQAVVASLPLAERRRVGERAN